MIDVKKHIQTIINDIPENKDMANIFLKVQVLAHLLKNEKLSRWLKTEQTGYEEGDLLPQYRIVNGTLCGSLEHYRGVNGSVFYKKMILPTSHIKEKETYDLLTKYRFIEPLSQIQKAVQKEGPLCITRPSAYFELLQKGLASNCYLNQVWLELQRADLTNIIEQVKSTLLQFLLEINDSLDLNVDLNSINNKKQIETAINNTIYATNVTMGEYSTINANNSTIVGGTGNTVIISNEAKEEMKKIITEIEALINDVDGVKTDIMDAIIVIHEELATNNPRPKFLKTAFNSLGAVGTGIIANQITPLINSAMEIINGF